MATVTVESYNEAENRHLNLHKLQTKGRVSAAHQEYSGLNGTTHFGIPENS